LLPKEILHRSKKGFAVPVAKWFRNGTMHLEKTSVSERVAANFAEQVLVQHRAGHTNQHAFLWSYLVLQTAIGRHI
jgi:asparagine synthase (glutamine-hydrolysing)